MRVKIKLVDKSLPLPQYQTSGAVAFDLVLRHDCQVDPYTYKLLPMNIIVEIPMGYMIAVVPRSSLIKKHGLICPHGFGVIDQDYHGPSDEIGLLVYNITEKLINLKKGDRLGQAMFVKIDQAEWEEITEDIKLSSRGGFGSTG